MTDGAPIEINREVNPKGMRAVLSFYPTGVAIITSLHGEKPIGFVVGSFTSISLEPPLVGFFMATTSTSLPLVQEASFFCVNVLGANQGELSARFSSKVEDRFDGIEWRQARSGAPILREAVAWLDCSVSQILEIGDHLLVVGRVIDLRATRDVTPLVFHRGSYSTTDNQRNDLTPIRETM
jgi:flavin reductase (DIM6/NTAB) family NADH-FMN oxidoreductase RutF